MSDVEKAASEAATAAAGSQTMEDYLKSWGLEIYIEKFKEHSIDLDTLQILSPEDIKELVPIIGHRAKLITQIALLKSIITDAFSESNKNTSNAEDTLYVIDFGQEENKSLVTEEQKVDDRQCKLYETLCSCNEGKGLLLRFQEQALVDHKLYETLCSCNEGKGLLLRFQEQGLLDNASRRRLCNLIINEELKDDPEKRMTSSRLFQLAYEISQVFKKESSSVYFIPFTNFGPEQKISAKGKLLDCYRQRRREFIKTGVIKGKERSSSSSQSEPGSPRPTTSTQAAVMESQDHEEESDIKEKLLWLKNCCNPWETVEINWNITAKARLRLLQSNKLTIQQSFCEFKALSQPGGIFLLLRDFQILYPDKYQKLTENWLLIRPKIIQLAKKRTDAVLKNMLCDIDNEQNEEVLDLAAFMAIPFLMTTSNVSKTKSKSKRLWRPSKQEVLEGFITHVTSAAQIEETIARRVEKLREFDLTLQPCIVVVGPTIKDISARYIIVNNVRYEVTSTVNAVDACFKTIFVLNAQYPAECANVWQFIQTALFQLKTKYDKIYTTVNTLLTDLDTHRE